MDEVSGAGARIKAHEVMEQKRKKCRAHFITQGTKGKSQKRACI